jgi:2-hydroxychromene-2-carboxylate isomerase
VPYVPVVGEPEDWRRLARACHAAEALGAGWAFARQLLSCVHAEGRMPADDVSLAVLADAVGLPGVAFAARVDWDQTHGAYETALSEALDQGVFGVPTFVTEGGELVFGQDRLPLLVDILERG